MKISICVPCHDKVHTLFTRSLVNLTCSLTKNNIDFEVHYFSGSVISESRTRLANEALEMNSNYILFLDSDMTFPASTVEKLLAHDKDIISGVYSTRYPPYNSVAFTNPEDVRARLSKSFGLHKVWAVGMGCFMFKTSLLHDLPRPWFMHEYNKHEDTFSGEDIYFCNQAMHHGYDVWVDADLKLSHIGTKAFML